MLPPAPGDCPVAWGRTVVSNDCSRSAICFIGAIPLSAGAFLEADQPPNPSKYLAEKRFWTKTPFPVVRDIRRRRMRYMRSGPSQWEFELVGGLKRNHGSAVNPAQV